MDYYTHIIKKLVDYENYKINKNLKILRNICNLLIILRNNLCSNIIINIDGNMLLFNIVSNGLNAKLVDRNIRDNSNMVNIIISNPNESIIPNELKHLYINSSLHINIRTINISMSFILENIVEESNSDYITYINSVEYYELFNFTLNTYGSILYIPSVSIENKKFKMLPDENYIIGILDYVFFKNDDISNYKMLFVLCLMSYEEIENVFYYSHKIIT